MVVFIFPLSVTILQKYSGNNIWFWKRTTHIIFLFVILDGNVIVAQYQNMEHNVLKDLELANAANIHLCLSPKGQNLL